MRRLQLACFALGSLTLSLALPGAALLGCQEASSSEHVIRTAEPIQGGTMDSGDSAVVAILINSNQGLSVCTGTLIAPNLVLSAHHCVADSNTTNCTNNGFGSTYAPSSFRVTTSVNAAASIFNSNNPTWPNADNATWWSVSSVAVPGNNICGQDMSLLRLSAPVNGVCPLIPRVDTQIADGDGYTAIGFGITSPNGQTAGTRYKVSGMSVECVTDCNTSGQSATLEWIGGANGAKGTCEGDSGGPAIDSTGRVIGTVSRGPQNSCNETVYESVYGDAAWIKQIATQAAQSGGYAAAGWVTGGSTSDAANGYCAGSSSSSSSSSSSTTSSSSSGGTSGGCPSGLTCLDGDGSGDYGCFDTNSSNGFPSNATTCTQVSDCPSGYNCWAADANATTGSCIKDCTPGASSSSSSSSSSTSASSSSGAGTTSSTSSSGVASSSSTTSSGIAGSSSGVFGGSGGATGAGGGANAEGGGGNDPGNSSGCSVAPAGRDPASPAPLAGLLLGTALAFSRRRRAE